MHPESQEERDKVHRGGSGGSGDVEGHAGGERPPCEGACRTGTRLPTPTAMVRTTDRADVSLHESLDNAFADEAHKAASNKLEAWQGVAVGGEGRYTGADETPSVGSVVTAILNGSRSQPDRLVACR